MAQFWGSATAYLMSRDAASTVMQDGAVPSYVVAGACGNPGQSTSYAAGRAGALSVCFLCLWCGCSPAFCRGAKEQVGCCHQSCNASFTCHYDIIE